MKFLFGSLAAFLLSAAGMAGTASERLAEPPDLVFARAESLAEVATGVFLAALGEEDYDFDVDLDAGRISFIGETKVVSAPLQVIGTYNTLDGTFLWGWDHPSVPKGLDADARLARAFGQRNRLPQFTTRKVECSEDEAWRFTAVALYLSDAQGLYRAPFGTTMVFLTFGEVSITPID